MTDGPGFIGQHVLTKWGPGGYRSTTPGRVIAYTDKPTVSIEYPDGTREDWIADLVEIVEPPVALPERPTLGWLSTRSGPGDSPLADRLGIYFTVEGGVTDNSGAGLWPTSCVVDFTPATAVPADALTALRKAWRAVPPGCLLSDLELAVRDLFRAIDLGPGERA